MTGLSAVQGDYKGIMVVVTPCRSDRSTLGLLPYSHLNDGRLHVILIRSCSVLQYLRFLASIPQTGEFLEKHPALLSMGSPIDDGTHCLQFGYTRKHDLFDGYWAFNK